MKKKLSFFLLIMIAVLFLHGNTKKETSNLPPSYKKWLEEEVVYIIIPIEKEVFLKLKTDRERDLFIEAFWKHRDTNPATPENEFRQEHYPRINYANLVFFQEGGLGEYKLYSPLKDGPQALMTSYWGDPMDYLEAYERLREFEPDLAQVSLSLIPGDKSKSASN